MDNLEEPIEGHLGEECRRERHLQQAKGAHCHDTFRDERITTNPGGVKCCRTQYRAITQVRP